MSFTDIITVASSLTAIVTGFAAVVQYLSKNGKSKEGMLKFTITTLITLAFLAGAVALAIGLSQPTIAVNRYTGVPLPGQPAPTEPDYNTVVGATDAPTPPTVTKTIVENKTLTCIDFCYSDLNVVLNSIVIDANHRRMTWNFTVTNNGTNVCSQMNVPFYLEDSSGVQTKAVPPGTLTEGTPLNVGQTLQEYTTLDLIPQPGVPYTLHASPSCTIYGGGDTDQVETFTF